MTPRFDEKIWLNSTFFSLFLPHGSTGMCFCTSFFGCDISSTFSKRHTGTLIFYMLIFDAFFRFLIAFFRSNFVIYTPVSRNCGRTWKSLFFSIFLRFFDEFYYLFFHFGSPYLASVERRVEIYDSHSNSIFLNVLTLNFTIFDRFFTIFQWNLRMFHHVFDSSHEPSIHRSVVLC